MLVHLTELTILRVVGVVGRRGSLLVASEVGGSSGVAVVTHWHVVRRVLDELVRRRSVDGGQAVEVTSGDKSGMVVSAATHVVIGLALDLALDALAVGRVADHGCGECESALQGRC